jgi:hypothetical protein
MSALVVGIIPKILWQQLVYAKTIHRMKTAVRA